MPVRITHFRPSERGAKRALGDLEAAVMDRMWACDRASVREIHVRMQENPSAYVKSLAYTTVMTVMTRLAEKGLLAKEPVGKQNIYRASLTREEFEEAIDRSVLEGLTGKLGSAALASFVEGIDDEETLNELDELIRRKRGV